MVLNVSYMPQTAQKYAFPMALSINSCIVQSRNREATIMRLHALPLMLRACRKNTI